MHRFKLGMLCAGAALAFALTAGVVLQRAAPNAEAVNATSGIGGEISFGTITFSAPTLTIPIVTTAATDPYFGANVNLRFDTSVFAFNQQVVATGNTLRPVGTGAPLCLSSTDAGGVVVSCSQTGATFQTTAAGTLFSIQLDAIGVGCSALRLVTIQEADPNDSTFGTYTNNRDPIAVQLVTYGDINEDRDETGAVCTSAPPTPTATATDTATPGPSVTPSNTSVPGTATSTPQGGLRTVTPSPGPSQSPTAGAATPPPTGGSPVATQPGGGAGAGSGGPGGVLRPPDTGTGPSTGWNAWLVMLAGGLLLGSVGSFAAGAWAWRRR